MARRAVLFDLDHTLWQIGAPPDWREISDLQSAALAPDFARLQLTDIDRGDFVRRFWENFADAFVDPILTSDVVLKEPRWRGGPSIVRNTLAQFGHDCSEHDCQRLWESLNDVPLRHFNVQPFADAATTIERLDATGYRLAIVTDRPLGARVIARELIEQGLPSVFDPIVSAGDLGYRKAHPLVFETALARLNVPPGDAVVVGDSYEDDIVPAARIGMIPVLKLNDRQPDRSWVLARHQIRSLADLLQLEILSR